MTSARHYVSAESTARRSRLLAMLRERSYREGRFVLSSGEQSDFFIDCKPTVLSAEGHALVGRALLEEVHRFDEPPRAVAGVVLGGCPLASAVAHASWIAQKSSAPEERGGWGVLDAVLVRKEAKSHGTARRVEGAAHLIAAPVVLVEDTVTTGGSTLRAAEGLRAEGLRPIGVVAIVDREEGAGKAFAAASLPFRSLFTRSSFLEGP